MAAALRMDSSTTLMTTTLQRPISSPKLAVTSQAMLLSRQHTCGAALQQQHSNISGVSAQLVPYSVPHCVLTNSQNRKETLLETTVLLESVSEETIASMVVELGLEELYVLPELHVECDYRGGILVKRQY